VRKIIKALCVTLAVAVLTACDAKTNDGVTLNANAVLYTVTDDWKKETVKTVVDQLNQLANDDKYNEAMGYSSLQVIVEKVKNVKIASEKEIVVYNYRDGAINRILSENNVSMDDFSEAAKNKLKKTAQSSISNMMISEFGASVLASYSILQTMETYAVDKAIDNQIWVIPTDSEGVYIVANIISSDGIYPLCTISCGYLVSESEDVLETIEASMNRCGMKPVRQNW